MLEDFSVPDIINAVGDNPNGIIVLGLLILVFLTQSFFRNDHLKVRLGVFSLNIIALVCAALIFFFGNRIVVYETDINDFARIGCLPFMDNRSKITELPPKYSESFIKLLSKNSEYQNLLVVGYGDMGKTREYARSMGERRANAAKDFLVKEGFSPGSIRTISVGREYTPLIAGTLFCGAWVTTSSGKLSMETLGIMPSLMYRDFRMNQQ